MVINMISIIEGTQLLISAGTATVAYFAFKTLRESVNFSRSSLEQQEEYLRAHIQIECLNQYIKIQKTKREAGKSKDSDLCYDYYRELFDLHWTEFNLWKKGHILDSVMRAWLDVRSRNFKKDKFDAKFSSGENVSYQLVWEDLVKNKYFSPEDDFIRFMELIHDGKIDKAMKEGKK